MQGGPMILCDWNNDKIKLLDRSLKVVDSLDLPGRPHDVAAISSSNVIVTIPVPGKKQLQFIQVSQARSCYWCWWVVSGCCCSKG